MFCDTSMSGKSDVKSKSAMDTRELMTSSGGGLNEIGLYRELD